MEYSISLSKSDIKKLLDLLYMGDWMVNGVKISDEKVKEYDEVLQNVYRQLYQHGFYDLLVKEGNRIYSQIDFDEGYNVVDKYIKSYDEEIFWVELIERLAKKKMLEDYSLEDLNNMDEKKFSLVKSEYLKKYADEFMSNGLDNLDIRDINS